jgi:hypothetical protein
VHREVPRRRGVEYHEQHAALGERAPQGVGPGIVTGRLRRQLRLRGPETHDPRRRPEAPGRPLRIELQRQPHGRAGRHSQRQAHLAGNRAPQRQRLAPQQRRSAVPGFEPDLEGDRYVAGIGAQLRLEAQLRRLRRQEREAQHAGCGLHDLGNRPRARHREQRGSPVRRERAEPRVVVGADHESVEGGGAPRRLFAPEQQAQAVGARQLRLARQLEPVAPPAFREREPADLGTVQERPQRLAGRRRKVEHRRARRWLRPAQQQLRFAFGHRRGVTFRDPFGAQSAGLPGLRLRRAEQPGVPGRPQLGDRRALRQVESHARLAPRAAEQGQGRACGDARVLQGRRVVDSPHLSFVRRTSK